MDSILLKKQLRREAIEKRQTLHAELQETAPEQFAKLFFDFFDLKNDDVIAGFSTIRSEASVEKILLKALAQNLTCALPVVVDQDVPLIFRKWAPETEMTGNTYGILEPVKYAPQTTPTYILVPCLYFTAQGHRLGYGGGFYDRTLDLYKDTTTSILVNYAGLEIDELPLESTDISVDYILTEKEIRKAGS